MQDRADVAEGLMRRDERRKDTLGAVAVHGLDDAPPPGARLGRVEHAQANPVAQEARSGRAAHRKGDTPVPGALDLGPPVEVHGATLVMRQEANLERSRLGCNLEIPDLVRDRGPALGAQREVDAAQDLALAEADPAQLAAVEDEPQRPGAERNRDLGRVVNGDRILRGGAGHRSPPVLCGAETYQAGAPLSTPLLEPWTLSRRILSVACSKSTNERHRRSASLSRSRWRL